jgi:hypothetical protein
VVGILARETGEGAVEAVENSVEETIDSHVELVVVFVCTSVELGPHGLHLVETRTFLSPARKRAEVSNQERNLITH